MAEPLLDKQIAEYLNGLTPSFGGLWSERSVRRRVLFFGEEPEEPAATITVIEEPGGAPTNVIGENRAFTVRCRDETYEAAKETAQKVHRALHHKEGILSTVKVGLILAESNPVFLGKDPNKRPVFQQTFTAITKPVAP